METLNYIFFGWASAILGRSTRAMKSRLLVNINYKESSLTLKSDEVQILTAHKTIWNLFRNYRKNYPLLQEE